MRSVDDFIAGFKSDENLRFAGMKDFWTLFLKGDISKYNLNYSGDAWEWENFEKSRFSVGFW